MEKLYPDFLPALALGKYNEDVIAHEFEYQGIPLIRTQGKHPFDFYLPTGEPLEVKIDLRSQCTGCGAVEKPTLDRKAAYYVYTFTQARVYPLLQLQKIYEQGRVPAGGFGNLGYEGRYCKGMMEQGMPLKEFIDWMKN